MENGFAYNVIKGHNKQTVKVKTLKFKLDLCFMVTRVHMLKCHAFFTNHWYYVNSPKYKALLQFKHKLNINQEN